jgi:apolipoprotein N-acyltransferase
MQDPASSATSINHASESNLASRLRLAALPLTDWISAVLSAALLILAFPNFEFWPLAAVGLVPLLLAVAIRPRPWRSFLLGWLTGSVFFYGSCYWLTYSMIHYGGIPTALAYVLLIPVPLIVGVFAGIFSFVTARAVRRWGVKSLLAAAFVWPALEWARLGITGQLWNALGYSLAYKPSLIQAANWGGVYAVSFALVAINAAVAFVLIRRTVRSAILGVGIIIAIALLTTEIGRERVETRRVTSSDDVLVVALQPNVPMDLIKSTAEMQALTQRHVTMTEAALNSLPASANPRLVIWPESPMNFAYGNDSQLRELLVNFAKKHHTSILFNSQEPAPNNGIYNSALFINERGELIAQYDKIRLMPFGEYVPLPHWMPGASLITAIVGDFTPGTRYTLMPVGQARAGVFICIESAYPFISRGLTNEGADVLINISNDGYLGPTAVRRQHLANAVFRAVENGRDVLRVTNTGISAYITRRGQVQGAMNSFEPAVDIWRIGGRTNWQTFYTRHGDLFVGGCAMLSLLLFVSTFLSRTKRS